MKLKPRLRFLTVDLNTVPASVHYRPGSNNGGSSGFDIKAYLDGKSII